MSETIRNKNHYTYMSAYSDIYNIWGYPRPVGLIPKECCCNVDVDVDVEAIKEAVIEAIGSTCCSCDYISEKIDEAKEEVIETVKENGCRCNDDECGCCPCCCSCGIEVLDGCGDVIDLNTLVGNPCCCN